MSVAVRRRDERGDRKSPGECPGGGDTEGPMKRVAVDCVRRRLTEEGYDVCGCVDIMAPFDIVAVKDDKWYLVTVKSVDARCKYGPIAFTSSEVDLATRIANRYLIYIVYVDGGRCVDIEYYTFTRFKELWVLQERQMGKYQYLAVPRRSAVV